MHINDSDPIKTRPDGSIDTDYYIQRGRRLRSVAAHEIMSSSSTPKSRPARQSIWNILRSLRTA